MERNKRILTFAEFSKEYSKGDPRIDGPQDKGIELMKDAASELNEPVIKGSKGEMDSITSGPATSKLKTDYELTPQPQRKDKKEKDVEEIESKSIDSVETEKIEDVDKENLDNIKKKKTKTIKKIKSSSKQTEEDKREEAGEY